MVKTLSAKAESQLTRKDITKSFQILINDITNTNIISHSQDFSYEFGIATLRVELNNDSGIYSPGCSSEIKLGEKVKLIERFFGTGSDSFTNFTGYVRQREVSRNSKSNTIILTCHDYLVKLEETDIQARIEADKIEVINEILSPTYLPAPNENLATIYNFVHEALATDPPIGIVIKDKNTLLEYPQSDGFEINYETGQLTLGSALNARYNYDVIVKKYYFYPIGKYAEDILETIITTVDGYGHYLFSETSAQAVIDNHLTETLLNVEGRSTDTLVPNYLTETKTIRAILTVACVAGDTTITVDDTSGFPTSGTGDVNGDVFTWTGKTATTLTGIPNSGSSALKAHPVGSNVCYDGSYVAGRLWYLTYSNLITDLVSGNFTIPTGRTIDYIDKKAGFIILDSATSTSATLTCNISYSFKTVQATGIEINKIDFSYEKTDNRLDAIKKVREFLAPNYLIRTLGTDKIWASYVRQKTTHDYELKLKTKVNYAEDLDVYTHTKFFGKAQNPKNTCLEEDVALLGTGETYSATATESDLTYLEDEGNYRVYFSGLTAAGWITTENIQPVVFVNGSPIDNRAHEVLMQQVTVLVTTRTETRTGCHGVSKTQYVKTHTYFYYKIYFAHTNIVRTEPIYIYGPTGVLLYTLGPDDERVNYEEGIWSVPGEEQNATIEQCSTASYYIFYASNKLIIDFANVKFKIEKALIPDVNTSKVKATFEYYTVLTAIDSAGNLFDGRWDTQVQTVFYAKPPSGYIYAILDLGQAQSIQALDLIHGFFKPDNKRSFDITNKYTIQYSLDNITYFNLCKEATNFNLAGGEGRSFERDKLGDTFSARYFKLIINDMNKIEYGNGIYVAAFVEFAAYKDIILTGEAFLIPTTYLNGAISSGAGTLVVDDTSAFDDSGSAYIETETFGYRSKTTTSFLQCSGSSTLSGIYSAHANDARVSETLESDSTIYDIDGILFKLGDKLYKDTKLNYFLDTQTRANKRAKDYAMEFYKNHTRSNITLVYAPHIRVAQTVLLSDEINKISRRYFVESLKGSNEEISLTLAYYP